MRRSEQGGGRAAAAEGRWLARLRRELVVLQRASEEWAAQGAGGAAAAARVDEGREKEKRGEKKTRSGLAARAGKGRWAGAVWAEKGRRRAGWPISIRPGDSKMGEKNSKPLI